MRVLITGVSGFIGRHLLHSAPNQYDIWGTYLDHANVGDPTRYLRVDLRNQASLDAVLEGVKPSVIIHCAGYSRVALCEEAPSAAWEMNTKVTMGLSAVCAQKGIRLIFISSDMVFDGKRGMYSEEDDPNPINYYGWTKLAAERRITNLVKNSAIVRVNLTYGQPKGGGSSFSEEVISSVRSGRAYKIFADQKRSFISVQNLSQCIWDLVGSDFTGTIHLGGSEPANRITFVNRLAARVGLDKKLLIPSTTESAAPGIPYPKNDSFKVDFAARTLHIPLLDLDEGLALEYPS